MAAPIVARVSSRVPNVLRNANVRYVADIEGLDLIAGHQVRSALVPSALD